jgi:hypothetical protein
MKIVSTSSKRFDIALSFPGEYRNFMGELAESLAGQLGRERILYDKYYEDEFALPDLDIYLPNLYRTQSELVAIFLCKEYAAKRWCKLEWRSIRQLIATAEQHRIMFLSFDDVGAIPEIGIFNGDGYVSIGNRRSEEIAKLIIHRFKNPPGSIISPIGKTIQSDDQKIAPTRLRLSGGECLFGREDELAMLDKAWSDPNTHVVTIVAWGGVGKTALVSHWQAALAKRNYDGATYFDWSFYSNGSSDKTAESADMFIKSALIFFGDPEMAESPAAVWDKGARLAELIAKRRTLLILDGLEPLQYAPGPMTGHLKDLAITALLKGLAQKNPGLCVINTRLRVTDLDSFRGITVQQNELKQLSDSAGVALLEKLGVHGEKEDFVVLVKEVQGHALTLNLIGRYLTKAHHGDIRKRDQVKFEKADAKIQGGHAFRMLATYERWLNSAGEDGRRGLAILRLIGLFEQPADERCMNVLRESPAIRGLTKKIVGVGEDDWNLALSYLSDCDLILVNKEKSAIDTHPLVREYFSKQLREKNPEGWKEGHRRLYEYLTTSTVDKPNPTLEDLQPLFQAVAHGCKAGLYEEAREKVYRDRIGKGTGYDGFYTTHKLGAFSADLGAVARFFEEPWKKVSPLLTKANQAWLLNQAAVRLHALGRLTEAVEPLKVTLGINISNGMWENAAAVIANLSELELRLGHIEAAIQYSRQSLELAEKNKDPFRRILGSTVLADHLHQAGKNEDTLILFQEAETLQAKLQPDFPLLYSQQGFRYCDFLLTKVERIACQKNSCRSKENGLESVCHEVEKRAIQTKKWAEINNIDLLNTALDDLTLGRSALYLSIFFPSDVSLRQSATENINAAVNGLGAAGRQDYLPRGLLTRAWLCFLKNDQASSRANLDEAQEIAERGPMRLYLADIHLYRGRFFKDKSEIAKARALIEQCGYWRRKGELEDAEAESRGW